MEKTKKFLICLVLFFILLPIKNVFASENSNARADYYVIKGHFYVQTISGSVPWFLYTDTVHVQKDKKYISLMNAKQYTWTNGAWKYKGWLENRMFYSGEIVGITNIPPIDGYNFVYNGDYNWIEKYGDPLNGDVVYDEIVGSKGDDDIPNFDWSDDKEGIRIFTPVDGSKIKGYTQNQSANYKYYDIVIYGRYISKNGLFDTVDSIKAYIQNSVEVSHNGVTKRVGEGVGIKDFEWITPPKDGKEAQFKIVLYQGMWKTGVSDLKVKLTVKHYDGSKKTFEDINKDINLLSDNQDDNLYEPPVDDDDAIGGDWNDNLDGTITDPVDKPNKPDSLNPVDWIIYIIDYITHLVTSLINSLTTIINEVVKAFSNLINEFTVAISKFTKIFSMLPSPMPQLIVLSLSVLCMTTIVRLIRG